MLPDSRFKTLPELPYYSRIFYVAPGELLPWGNVQCIIEPECLELRVPLSTLTVPFPQNSLPLGALKTED